MSFRSSRIHRLLALFLWMTVTIGQPAANAKLIRANGEPVTKAGALNRPIADKWALVIGVGNFLDPSIPKLQYAAKDAQDFAEFLVKKANFAPDHVRLLLNKDATQRRILTELGDKFLPRVVKPGDLVLIYFSGHGSPSDIDVKSKNYVVAYDTEKSNLFASGIDVQDLTKLIKSRVDTDRVLLVLDACHSGAADARAKAIGEVGAFDPVAAVGEGQMIICSSTKDERSWESKRYPNGVFTHYLMEAMAKNGSSGRVSKVFHDMQEAVHDEVQQDQGQRQTPLIKSQWTGEDPEISAKPTAARPLPEAVRNLLQQSLPVATALGGNGAMMPPPASSVTEPPSTFEPRVASAGSNVSSVPVPSRSYTPELSVPPPKQGWLHNGGISQQSMPQGTMYSPPDQSFAVRMPGTVQINQQMSPNGAAQLVYNSTTANGMYTVNAIRMSTMRGGSELILGYLAGQFLGGLARQGFQTQQVRQFQINGHPAYEYKVWNSRQQGRLVYCCTSNTAFAFSVYVTSPGSISEGDEFFNSIYVK